MCCSLRASAAAVRRRRRRSSSSATMRPAWSSITHAGDEYLSAVGLPERGFLEMHDRVGRHGLRGNAPALQLPPVDLQRRRHRRGQRQRGRGSAIEQRDRGLCAEAPDGVVARHAAADDARADEGRERPVDRRRRSGGDELGGLARRELAPAAVAEEARGEHDRIGRQIAQPSLQFDASAGRPGIRLTSPCGRPAVWARSRASHSRSHGLAPVTTTSRSRLPDASAAPARRCRQSRTSSGVPTTSGGSGATDCRYSTKRPCARPEPAQTARPGGAA